MTITFDEFGLQPSTFDAASPVNDKYLADGVRFRGPNGSTEDGGVLLNDSTFTVHAHSGNNFLAFSRIESGNGVPIDPETITFLTPVNHVSIWAASVDTTHQAKFSLVAFDALNNQIGSDSLPLSILQWGLLSIDAPGISRVVLHETSSAHTFVYDDLNFGSVPEPCTFGLAGLGGVLLLRRRQR